MIASFFGWIFGLIGRLWDGFWNVSGKLLKLMLFTAASGAVGAMIAKFAGLGRSDVLYFFKCGAMAGFLVAGIKLLIDEVAVPLVHAQTDRERMRKRQEFERELAKSRSRSTHESVSNRLKHLQ